MTTYRRTAVIRGGPPSGHVAPGSPRPEHFAVLGREYDPEPLHYPQCGLSYIYLLNGFRREEIDGEECITVEDQDGLWKAIGLHLVTRRKVLRPTEIRFLRRHMDLTQLELAQYLRVSDQTVARWEKGLTGLPGPADVMIRYAFLSSSVAQPEGRELETEFRAMIETLAGTEEIPMKKLVFRHGEDRWRESQPQAA